MATPSYKLSEIAARLGLQLELKSPEDDIVITGINTLEEAGPSELSFLANPKYASQLASTKAGAVIVKPEHKDDVVRALVTDNPYPMFAQALTLFARPQGSFTPSFSAISDSLYVGVAIRGSLLHGIELELAALGLPELVHFFDELIGHVVGLGVEHDHSAVDDHIVAVLLGVDIYSSARFLDKREKA